MFLVFNAACYSNYLPTMMLIECDLDRDKKCWGRKIKTMAGGWYRIKLQTYLQLLSLRLAEGSSETSAADQWMERNLMEGHEIFPAKQKHQKNPPPTKTHANDNISTSLGAPKCEASGRMFIRKIYGLCDNVELRKQEWGMRWQALFISRSKRAIICSCKNFNHAACVIFHEMNYSFSFFSAIQGCEGCRRFCDAAWASP